MSSPRRIPARILTIMAQEPEGKVYEYEAHLLPGGEVLIPGETCADTFWASKEEVQAIGNDQIAEIRETDGVSSWTPEEIREAVQQSAREFGLDALPASLLPLLLPAGEPSDAQNT